jgi:hypothetical protein
MINKEMAADQAARAAITLQIITSYCRSGVLHDQIASNIRESNLKLPPAMPQSTFCTIFVSNG